MFTTTNIALFQLLNACVSGKNESRHYLQGIIFTEGKAVATDGNQMLKTEIHYPEFMEGLSITLPKITSKVKQITIEDRDSNLGIKYVDKNDSITIIQKKVETTLQWKNLVGILDETKEKSLVHDMMERELQTDKPVPVTVRYDFKLLNEIQKLYGVDSLTVEVYRDCLYAKGSIWDNSRFPTTAEWQYKLLAKF